MRPLAVKLAGVLAEHCDAVLPLEVTGPISFLLVAVWAKHNLATQRIHERPNRWQVKARILNAM